MTTLALCLALTSCSHNATQCKTQLKCVLPQTLELTPTKPYLIKIKQDEHYCFSKKDIYMLGANMTSCKALIEKINYLKGKYERNSSKSE